MSNNEIVEQNNNVWLLLGQLYLVFPVILYFIFWLRLPFNLLFCAAIAISLLLWFRQHTFPFPNKTSFLSKDLWALVLVALLFAYLSGAGGFVWQKPDWTKHNVILNDLIKYDWPVYYGKAQFVEYTSLVYYFAYYLPAAFVGKIFGWEAAQFSLFIQNFVGIFIFSGLLRSTFKIKITHIFLFFFLSGADIIGMMVFGHWPNSQHLHLETPITGIQFSSILTQLMWVPQHALSGWVAVLVAYNDFVNQKLSASILLLAAIVFLWSPFAALGLLLVFGIFTLSKKMLSFSNILGMAIFVVVGLFYKSTIPLLKDQIGLYLLGKSGLLLQSLNMIVFLFIEIGIFLPVLAVAYNNLKTLKAKIFIVWVSVTLVIIAQLTYGAFNDFAMRVSIPSIVLLYAFVLKNLDIVLSRKKFISFFVVAALLLGMATPFTELYQLSIKPTLKVNQRPTKNMLYAHTDYGILHQQYMGLATKMFGRLFGNYPVR